MMLLVILCCPAHMATVIYNISCFASDHLFLDLFYVIYCSLSLHSSCTSKVHVDPNKILWDCEQPFEKVNRVSYDFMLTLGDKKLARSKCKCNILFFFWCRFPSHSGSHRIQQKLGTKGNGIYLFCWMKLSYSLWGWIAFRALAISVWTLTTSSWSKLDRSKYSCRISFLRKSKSH